METEEVVPLQRKTQFVSEISCKRKEAGSKDSCEGSALIARERSMSFGIGGGACKSGIPSEIPGRNTGR